jgi:hypothetical protein
VREDDAVVRAAYHALCAIAVAFVVLALAPNDSHADAPSDKPAPAAEKPPSDSWAGQLEALGRWVAQRQGSSCTERCFTLSRLRLGGSVASGLLKFELEGNVLASGMHPVPLFGAPAHVRIQQATEGGKPAAIGFEGERYYFATSARHFVLKGSIALDEDRVLTIPGPLNSLETDLADGRCVEGSRLSGLSGTTVHFDRALAKQPSVEPTVFQLSRAVRVAREINFEYRLVMRSGTDLGVVRLPLSFGERVLEATGVAGFRVDGGELVLPTSGHSADIRITGTLAQVGSFKTDDRSSYEWWLLESDAEHRITVTGDARQVDSAESPIARTLPTSRLYMVQRGQHIDVAVQTLASIDVLAAVVRDHERTVVLTRRGDLVSDETLHYENNGIDYLLMNADGRPIYLATDGKSERILHRDKGAPEVMIPLRTGSHAVRVQSLSQAGVGALFGKVEVPLSTYPLTASRVGLRLGLPAFVYPIALLGGDRPEMFVDEEDFVALAAAAFFALVLFRSWTTRVLGAIAIGGLWFISQALFTAVIGIIVLGGLVWLAGRFLSGTKLVVVAGMLLLGGAFFLSVALVAVSFTGKRAASRASEYAEAPASVTVAPPADVAKEEGPGGKGRDVAGKTGNFLAQNAAGGVLEGVTPVALTLPAYERSTYASRELVTRERPFRPVLLYATSWAILPLGVAWLACVVALLRAHARWLSDLFSRVRARLARGPTPAPEPPPVERG